MCRILEPIFACEDGFQCSLALFLILMGLNKILTIQAGW